MASSKEQTRALTRAAWRILLRASFVGCAIAWCGCQQRQLPTLPPMYPATGKVVAPAKVALEGSTVEFRPKKSSSEFIAQGSLNKDGEFSLRTSHRGGMVDGLTEGPYEVAIYFPVTSPRAGERVVIDKPFTVEPRDDNFFTINLP